MPSNSYLTDVANKSSILFREGGWYNNKTNHPISSNSHPSATANANKAIHTKIGGGLQNQREYHILHFGK